MTRRSPVDLLTDLLRAADAKPSLDPERSTGKRCFICDTSIVPRTLVTVGMWLRTVGSRGDAGDPIDRPLCDACIEATIPLAPTVTRTVPCVMCRSDVKLGSANTPDPECPEMLQLPPGAWIGVVGSPGGGTIVVTCRQHCLDKLMAQGLFQ
jgi:hypothetical protein